MTEQELRERIREAIVGEIEYPKHSEIDAATDAVIEDLGLTVETSPGHKCTYAGCETRARPTESRVVGKWEKS